MTALSAALTKIDRSKAVGGRVNDAIGGQSVDEK